MVGTTRRRTPPLAVIAAAVVVAIIVGVVLAAANDDQAAAQVLAGAGLVAVSVALFSIGPRRPMARREIELEGQTTVAPGTELPQPLPARDAKANELVEGRDYAWQHGLYFHAPVLGKDGRWSTSKVQPLIWTYALLYGLLSLIIAYFLGDHNGWEAQRNAGVQEEYLILLGGPFAAAVLSKAIVSSKSESGTVQKTDASAVAGPVRGLGEIVSDDQGNTDLIDLQYFLFNLVTLVFFAGAFASDLDAGLPKLPGLLVGLTGVSAATYVSKKAADRSVPILMSVVPARAEKGDRVEVFGQHLISPGTHGQSPRVLIDDVESEDDEDVKVLKSSRAGTDHLEVKVPEQANLGKAELRLVTAVGVEVGKPLPFEVEAKTSRPRRTVKLSRSSANRPITPP